MMRAANRTTAKDEARELSKVLNMVRRTDSEDEAVNRGLALTGIRLPSELRMMLAYAALDAARSSHVYFAPYREFSHPRDDVLEMEAPDKLVIIRAIGYQDRQDQIVTGDDRIIIYYEVPS
jgi:hypothetical protein